MTLSPKNEPQIELVGVYPEKNNKKVFATFHVYLVDKDVDVRGGVVFRKKDGTLFVQVPQGRGTCDETGKMIKFPIVSFTDKDYEKAFRKEVTRLVLEEMKKQDFLTLIELKAKGVFNIKC